MTSGVRAQTEAHSGEPTQEPARDSTAQRPDPQPWTTPEDAEGWRLVARGKRQPRRIAVSVMVEFDLDQSEWLSQEAERTGLSYDALIRHLVDTRRAGE